MDYRSVITTAIKDQESLGRGVVSPQNTLSNNGNKNSQIGSKGRPENVVKQ